MGNTTRNTSSIKSLKPFKIRCSAIGQIMGIKGLGKTGQSYCETWLKEQLFNRRKEFSNRYTQKGLIVEDNSIDFVGEMLKLGFIMKNEKSYDNDYFTGTPDVILKDLVIDVKNSWDVFTFPYFDKDIPNSDYYWQAQGYLKLTDKQNYKLIYVLSDTPEHLIESEMRKYGFQNGIEQDDLNYREWFDKMTYSDIPNEMRIKVFEIKRNDEDIEKIEKRVLECREFINTLIK